MYTIIISWLTSYLVDKIKSRSASHALWYHRVKNKVVTSQYSHIHHRFMVDELPVNSNTGATNLYRHIFQTVTVAYKMTLLCNDEYVMINTYHTLVTAPAWGLTYFFVGLRSNVHTMWPVWYSILTQWWNDPPVRVLYSIFDLGISILLRYFDICYVMEQLNNTPFHHHHHVCSMARRLFYGFASYVQLIQPMSERCITYHFQVNRSKVKVTRSTIAYMLPCAMHPQCEIMLSCFQFSEMILKKILSKHIRKYNFHVINAVVWLISYWKIVTYVSIDITGAHQYFFWKRLDTSGWQTLYSNKWRSSPLSHIFYQSPWMG